MQVQPDPRWLGQAGQHQGPRSPRSLESPHQRSRSLGQGTPRPEKLPRKPSLILPPLSEQNKAAGAGRAGTGSNADICSHCHEGSWSESQAALLKGSWHPGWGSLVEEGVHALQRQEGPQGCTRQLSGEAQLRSYAHSVMSRPFLPLLGINGTNHLLPRVAELQHHLSHLHAVLLLKLSKATVQSLIFQSQRANFFIHSCRSVLSGCKLLNRRQNVSRLS